MTWVDWLGLAVALIITATLPFLEAWERRESARDQARREEIMRQAREHYTAQIAALRRPLKAQGGRDE